MTCLFVNVNPYKLDNTQSKIKLYSLQPDNSDIQKDFVEVWKNIEKSIRIYEMLNEKHNIIIRSDKIKDIINLNIKL